ncbi:CaiB/BaiF CoA transferase family protein [Pseudohaliea rubra]|uniref:L-carnitine dehydratase/bile acid-inducible protein F n=1 Tax=Pseudohaliea rubra DSM 19751 TaxID=1265313 RepID=A0A095X0R8_9GAMM|nr:CaiB/BaiF CoA-transferase family protein [Pseudohaliea rubra]KGE04494.1 L-carnitine dehydratase/bile acid-inducible protein F [Pseudohaliea rubra DSM 19751]
MAKPLAGVRILDLTHMLSGPYGAMILADLGAETIKVEPLQGEGTRKLLATDPANSLEGQGAYFITLNRNKQSVALDLKSEEGLQVFYDLVKEADVVIENFSAGVADKLKISYPHLREHNRGIITCSISGFGSAGPNFQRPAFDQVVQALGGGMSITGTDAEHPTRAGIPIGDLGGGMFGVMGILSALYERERSGEGQHVDISMLDCQISMLNYMATMYFLSGQEPTPIGNAHFVHVPYNSYRTADGHIIIAVIFDSFWDNLLEVVDFEPFRDEKYKTQPARLADKDFIDGKLNEILATNTSDYWLKLLQEKRIPCARVNRFGEALADEQVMSRNMVVELEHPSGAKTRGPGNPIKLSRTSDESFSPAPLLGQHTETVLTGVLGYSAEQVAELREGGKIA